jgi:hypothetical protein
MSEETVPALFNRRFTYYASYVIVLGMLICLAIVSIQFMQWLVPTWNSSGMVLVCTLAAIEAAASHRLIKQLPAAQHQMAFYRITEWLILILLLKLYVELSLGSANFTSNMNQWLVKFPENIFNSRFFTALIPFAICWATANLFDTDLTQLGNFETDIQEEGVRSTVTVRNLILKRFLNVGLFIVIFAGIPPQTIVVGPKPASSNIVPAVVMYFILGIILLSLTRYSYLSSLWRLDKVQIPPLIPRRWLVYTAGIIVALGAVILLLPVKYGLGLLATLSAILDLVYKFIGLLYALIFIAVNFFSQLLFRRPTQMLPPEIIPSVTPAPVQLPTSATSPFWKVLESVLFWGLLGALVTIALRQYILFNKDLAEELKKFRPWRWLVLFWKRVTASVKKANKSVGIFVQSSIKRLRNIGRVPEDVNEWDYINPRRLNNRQKVIFYYLALLRRAEEAGLHRGDGQTPFEFEQAILPTMAEGEEAVETLTDSFVEARYSQHDIPRETTGKIESLWDTVRRRFKAIRKHKLDVDKP